MSSAGFLGTLEMEIQPRRKMQASAVCVEGLDGIGLELLPGPGVIGMADDRLAPVFWESSQSVT